MDKIKMGKIIARLRTEKKMTQQQLAQEVGVSGSAIQMYESGQRVPKDQTKVKISKSLGKSVKYIFFSH